jgi:SAM-dependent methyltransferase
MSTTKSAEAYIVNRYERLWKDWQPEYGYKHVKGSRIAEIIAQTGGFPAVGLEVGVGPGGVAAALSRRGIRVIGIDLSSDALMKAKEHCRADRVSLMRGSGFSLPFRDASLPLVYASQVLHLFDAEGRRNMMAEVHRVLKPGGRFVFDMKNASSHLLRVARYSSERRKRNFPGQSEIVRLLKETGFSTIARRPGVLPVLHWERVPNLAIFRALAHTTFFIATPRR